MKQRDYAYYYNAQLEAWSSADSYQIELERERLRYEIDISKAKIDALDKIQTKV